MNRRIAVIIAVGLIVGSLGLAQQAGAYFVNQKVWMSITNTRDQTVKVLEWAPGRFQFEHGVVVDVDPLKERKIEQIFGASKFTFTGQMEEHEATWYHFKVAVGTDLPTSDSLTVTFI